METPARQALVPNLVPRADLTSAIALNTTQRSAGTIVFAVSHLFWLSLVMLGITGAGNTISAVLRGTINQSITTNELRGRVASVNNIFVMGGPDWASSSPAWSPRSGAPSCRRSPAA